MKKYGKSLKTWKIMNNKKWHRWNIKSVEEDIDDNVELLMISSMMNELCSSLYDITVQCDWVMKGRKGK